MASTNKTQNLELSQFLGTDKPAWLADYNSDMEKIDNAFGNLSTEVSNIPLIKEELEEQDESLSARIDNVNTKILEMEEVNQQEAQELITLKNNYETMHHELVLTDEKVQENSADIETLMNSASGAYSTVEREVGTWIDGKKIYEKTVEGIFTDVNTNGDMLFASVGSLLTGIDCVIKTAGYIELTLTTGDTAKYVLGSAFSTGSATIDFSTGVTVQNNAHAAHLYVMSRSGGHVPNKYKVALQYTKI